MTAALALDGRQNVVICAAAARIAIPSSPDRPGNPQPGRSATTRK